MNKRTINVFTSVEEIEVIRPHWELLQNRPNSDIDFYINILKSRHQSVRPYVVSIGDESKPEFIAVGRKEKSNIPVKIGYKVLFNIKVNLIVFIYDGLLGCNSPQVNKELIDYVYEVLTKNEVVIAKFELIDSASDLVSQIHSLIPFYSREHDFISRNHWLMPIENSIDDIYAGLSRNHRNQLRRIIKKIENHFGSESVNIINHSAVDQLDQMFIDVESVAKKTYQRGLGVGFIDDAENRSRLHLEAEKNWLRMFVLYLEGKPVAFWWGVVYKDTFYSCALGFDPSFEDFSIGTYLLIKVLEMLCNEGVKNLDFGSGDARYKQQFGKKSYEETNILIFSPGLKGISINLVIFLSNKINKTAKALVEKFNLADLIKRKWRDKLQNN